MKFLKIIIKVICVVAALSAPIKSFATKIDTVNERVYSQVHEISSLNEIKNFAQINNPDIIIFDIDKTLITYVDAISQNGVNKFMADLKSGYKLSDDQTKLLMSLILSTSEYKVMEEKIDELLSDLSKYSPNIIALTNCRTGKFAQIDNVEKWKTNLIKEHGIKFPNHNFYSLNNTIFDDLLTESQKKEKIQYPIFIDGILYTGKYVNKGILLKAFVERLHSIPNTILVVDDQKQYLEDIKTAFQDTNIEFILLHYKSTDGIIIDDKIVEIQKKILLEEQRWVNDTEALEYLKNSPTL